MAKFCPKCGKENDDHNEYCHSCGANFSNYALSSKDSEGSEKKIRRNFTDKLKNPNNKEKVLIGVGIIIVTLILFALTMNYLNTDTTETSFNNENNTISDTSTSETPKTYKDDYFSFEYPGDFTLEVQGGLSDYISLYGYSAYIEIHNYTADESLSNIKEDIENVDTSYLHLQSSEYITLNGVKAYQYKRYNSLDNKYHIVTVFIKNGKEYQIAYFATTVNLDDSNMVLNSFKTF